MTFDTLPEHIRTPHLRPIQPVPLQKDGQQFVALRDPSQLVQQTMVIPAQAMAVLQQFNGSRDLESITKDLKAQADQIIGLAQGLDKMGLLWGPTFEEYEDQVKQKLCEHGAFPANAAGTMVEDGDEAACIAQMDEWLAETEDPELDTAVLGLVAPHLDYQRGWPNYAAAYKCIEQMDAPDRVLILGTNHFGLGDGAVLSEYGFETPLGRVESDRGIVQEYSRRLGKAITIDQLDHLPEHSVALQLPWLQRRWPGVPVVAVLVPDPLSPMIQEDDERISYAAFVSATQAILSDIGGSTFVVASADLSHVGPQFGEPRQVDDQRRVDVERHDRELMNKYLAASPEEFLEAMRWTSNPTRWCSVGNMTAALEILQPHAVELIDYRQASDERGMAMVSSAAMAMLAE
ncbi:MAG: AmmeMemoRadiSam system protein B [Phycisphaerales bacterium]